MGIKYDTTLIAHHNNKSMGYLSSLNNFSLSPIIDACTVNLINWRCAQKKTKNQML